MSFTAQQIAEGQNSAVPTTFGKIYEDVYEDFDEIIVFVADPRHAELERAGALLPIIRRAAARQGGKAVSVRIMSGLTPQPDPWLRAPGAQVVVLAFESQQKAAEQALHWLQEIQPLSHGGAYAASPGLAIVVQADTIQKRFLPVYQEAFARWSLETVALSEDDAPIEHGGIATVSPFATESIVSALSRLFQKRRSGEEATAYTRSVCAS